MPAVVSVQSSISDVQYCLCFECNGKEVVNILIGKVVDSIWATRKEESLTGIKFMVVELLHQGSDGKKLFVAADLIGAGIGERVILSQGSSARRMKELENTPIDMAIVGIIDADCNSIDMRSK